MPDLQKILTTTFSFIQGAATERKKYLPIPSDHVLGVQSSADDRPLSGECYFKLTLLEMFLRDRREYWREFLPFVLVLAEFAFDAKQRSVPIFVRNELLKSIEELVQDEVVEYRNTTLLGPTPYVGGGLRLFLGLFRGKNRDLASELVDLVGSISSVFPVGDLSRYLQLLAPIGQGVSTFLGMKDVELRIGVRDEFGSNSPLAPRYFAMINSATDPGELWIRDGELWVGEGQPVVRFSSADYCLFHLDLLRDRPVSDLSFARLWVEIKDLVWQGQATRAQTLLLELGRQLAISPDLTRSHRFDLMRLYKANLEKEIEVYSDLNIAKVSADRGRADLDRGGVDGVKKILIHLPTSSKVRQSITSMTSRWDQLMAVYPGGPKTELTDAILKSQLQVLPEASDEDPEELLSAFTMATILKR